MKKKSHKFAKKEHCIRLQKQLKATLQLKLKNQILETAIIISCSSKDIFMECDVKRFFFY